MISRLPSTPALSRATVDRDAATRDDPAALAEAWRTARVLVVSAGTALVEVSGFSRAQLRAAGTWASDEPVQSRIVRTPSPVSIAWQLISGWLEQD